MNIIEISIIKKVLNILSKKKLLEVHVLLLVCFWIADYNFLHLEQNVPEQHMKPLISILIPILLTTISFLLISYLKTFPHLKPKFGVYWDKGFQIYCPSCKTLLTGLDDIKHPLSDRCKLKCPNSNCENKEITLVQPNGHWITPKQAIEKMKTKKQ